MATESYGGRHGVARNSGYKKYNNKKWHLTSARGRKTTLVDAYIHHRCTKMHGTPSNPGASDRTNRLVGNRATRPHVLQVPYFAGTVRRATTYDPILTSSEFTFFVFYSYHITTVITSVHERVHEKRRDTSVCRKEYNNRTTVGCAQRPRLMLYRHHLRRVYNGWADTRS